MQDAALITPATTAPAIQHLSVLVVDDQAIQRTIVKRTLARLGHTVFEAESGDAALQVIDAHAIDLVISDWMMDGMDGLGLCRRLRQRQGRRYIYFILMSSRDAREDLLTGMAAGADDFLRKPLDVDELAVRLRSGQRVLELQSGLERRNGELEQAYARIQDDIDAAGVFQKGLLPHAVELDPGTQVAWAFLPSDLVSGDALNYFAFDAERLGFYLLDVAGHGVASAMVAMNVTQYLAPRPQSCLVPTDRHTAVEPLDPALAIARLNDRMIEGEMGANYLTCIYGVLDRRSGVARIVRAGHTLPVVVHAEGEVSVIEQEADFPVGLFPGVPFTGIDIALRPGSRLCLYSDGATDCENPAGELFGLARLLQFLKDSRQLPIQAVSREFDTLMRRWSGRPAGGFDDDISMLLVEFHPVPEVAPTGRTLSNPQETE
jgi:sigma-B regulation protein RsbU (phosphoserine phosphatase)